MKPMFKATSSLALSLLIGISLGSSVFGEAPASLDIEVIRADNDKPISQAVVRIQDKAAKGAMTELRSDASGKIHLPSLEEGEYYLEILHPDFSKDTAILKIVAGQPNQYRSMLDLAGQERVFKVKESRLLVSGGPLDGAVTKRDRDFIQTQLGDTSVQGILQTVPGTQRNSLGQVHVRGDHRSLTFAVDGLMLPPATTSSVTNPIDTDFFDNFEFRTGNYSGAQRGQVGLVFDAQTDWNRPGSFFELRPGGGNNGQASMMTRFGGNSEDGDFKYLIGAKTGVTDLGLEAVSPTTQTLNNRSNSTSLMARFKARIENDEFGLTAAHQSNNFQIPQTQGNFDAGVRQQQGDQSTALVGSWKHPIDDKSELLMGLAYVKNRQSVDNNGIFTRETIFDAGVSPDLAARALPASPLNPAAPYLTTTRLQLSQLQPSIRYTNKFSDKHQISAGLDADFIESSQFVNLIDAGGGTRLPGGGPDFAANVTRSGFLGGMFFSHTFPLFDTLSVNYGIRADRYNNGLGLNTGQISPTFNLGWTPTENDALRFSYNRLFQAPPLEIDVSGGTSINPQRVTVYELSYERNLGGSVTGKLAYVSKAFRDQVDIALLVPGSNIPLFAPINFQQAKYDGWEVSLNTHNKLGFNGFVTGTLSTAKPLQVDPSIVVPTFNDHDQRLQLAIGLSHKWENGLTVATDFNYGSGFPQDSLALYQAAGINPYGYSSDRIPRFVTNLAISYFPPSDEDGIQAGASLKINNLFDNRPLQNFFSDYSGTRFVNQRSLLLQGLFRF